MQLVRKTYPDGAVAEYVYDSLGSMVVAVNDSAELLFEYDDRQRLVSAQTTILTGAEGGSAAAPPYLVEYEYDLTGNRTSMQDAFGTTAYSYDDLNRLTGLADPIHGMWSFVHDQLYLREIRRPNGTATFHNYDEAGQLLQIAHAAERGPAWLTLDYDQYEGNGNLQALTRTTAAGSNQFSYGYDTLHRLVTTVQPSIAGADLVNAAPTYDDANRSSSDGLANYAHDLEGRRISKQELIEGVPFVATYQYDAEGRLTELSQQLSDPESATVLEAHHAYDAVGRRVRREVNGVVTGYVYDGDNLIYESNGTGVVLRSYTMGLRIDEPLAAENIHTGQRMFYHAERLGSIVALTDDAGAILREYLHDAHGLDLETPIGVDLQPYTYTAREYDTESNLFCYRNRYYDAAIGRFLTEDPIELRGGDRNYYVHLGNNPVNLIDPHGTLLPVAGAVVLAGGGLTGAEAAAIGIGATGSP